MSARWRCGGGAVTVRWRCDAPRVRSCGRVRGCFGNEYGGLFLVNMHPLISFKSSQPPTQQQCLHFFFRPTLPPPPALLPALSPPDFLLDFDLLVGFWEGEPEGLALVLRVANLVPTTGSSEATDSIRTLSAITSFFSRRITSFTSFAVFETAVSRLETLVVLEGPGELRPLVSLLAKPSTRNGFAALGWGRFSS